MTQDDAILQHLQAGRSITGLDALNEYGCMRLASVIWRLRKAHIIGRIMERRDTEYGHKKWARYYYTSPKGVQNGAADNDSCPAINRYQTAPNQGDHAERVQAHLSDDSPDARS